MKRQEDSPELVRLLKSREAAGLRVPAIARMVFMLLGLLLVLLSIAGATNTEKSSYIDIIIILGLAMMLSLNFFIYKRLKRERNVEGIGLVGAIFDSGFVVFLSVMAQLAGAGDGLNPGYVFKSELPIAILTTVVINGLALRPRYPAIVGAGAMVALIVPVVAMALDPSTAFSNQRELVYAGEHYEKLQIGMVFAFTLGSVLAVMYFTHVARQTVRRGIAHEIEQARFKQAQMRIVMQEKVRTLRRLVAGMSHELNSPLGAIRSSADTLNRVLARLEDGGGASGKLHRVGRQSTETIAAAVTRLSGLEVSLKKLSRLDEGEMQMVSINAILDEIVATVRRTLGDAVTVNTEYCDLPEVRVNGPEINQAFLTIITNAFEAAGPEGTVLLRTSFDAVSVLVEVSDDGPGLPEDKMRSLFDISFSPKGPRMGAGLGLPAAQSTAQSHGGELTVRSVPGEGATFSLRLPLVADDRDSDAA